MECEDIAGMNDGSVIRSALEQSVDPFPEEQFLVNIHGLSCHRKPWA